MICAVLVDGAYLPHWQVECIESLRECCEVELYAFGKQQRGSVASRLIGGRSLRRRSIEVKRGAVERCDLVIDLRTDAGNASFRANRAAYWSFREGDGAILGELPGSREIASGSPTFTIQLCASGDGGSTPLRRGRFKALYTYARSMDVALGECARWPALALRTRRAVRTAGWHRDERAPAPPPLWRLILRDACASAAHACVHLFVDARWDVGVIDGSPERFLSRAYHPKIRWLRDANTRFFADPFVLNLPNGRYVLGERLDAATFNGFISCAKIDADGRIVGERAVMRARTHLSYPYVFEHDGHWYMVPESAQEGCVALYRAVEVPYRWERVATLIEGVTACDSTIVRYAGRWWLFCTHASRDAHLNLFAYHSADLFGPWRAHAANPIKTDVRSARPAGKPFVVDGRLYRPAQDCAHAYGDAIAFNCVTKLSEDEFAEEVVAAFRRDEAGKRGRGVHTISYADGVVAIDAKTIILASPATIARRARRLAGRMRSRAS